MPPLTSLRQRAEARARQLLHEKRSLEQESLTPEQQYELQVHQIELEMLNDELRTQHHELSATLYRCNQLFEASPNACLLVDAAGVVEQVNYRACTLMQQPVDRLLGKPLVVHFAPTSHQAFFQLIQMAMQTTRSHLHAPEKEITPKVLEVVLPNKQTRLVEAVVAPIQRLALDGGAPSPAQATQCLISMTDITRRQEAERQLGRSERQFRSMVLNAGLPMVLLDAKGTHQLVNAAFTDMSGYASHEIIGKGMPHPYWPEWAAQDMALHFSQLLASGQSTSEVRIKHRDGRLIPALLTASALADDTTGGKQYMFIYQDITQLKDIQEEIVRAKEAAEEANKAKSAFLATMSHELRTPFNGIMGMLQLVQSTELSPEQAEYIQIALSSSKGLLELLNDLLDISRIEAGVLRLQHSTMNPARLTKSVVELFQYEARTKGLALEFHSDEDLPDAFCTDPARVRQVLINVVGNAVKFTHTGSVRVEVSTQQGSPSSIVFTVADTGPGIPPALLPILFEPFTQGAAYSTRPHSGAGLGLGIVKRLMDLMGGTVAVKSIPDQGATFRLTLPQAACEVPEAAQLPFPHAMGVPRKGLKVLVAEDNVVNQKFIELALEKIGHESTLVDTGVQALEALAEEQFDCVLMDVEMPEMDGLEATRRIRASEAQTGIPRLPILALTAHAMEEAREAFLEAGMDDVLAKPVELTDLEKCLQRFCSVPIARPTPQA